MEDHVVGHGGTYVTNGTMERGERSELLLLGMLVTNEVNTCFKL